MSVAPRQPAELYYKAPAAVLATSPAMRQDQASLRAAGPRHMLHSPREKTGAQFGEAPNSLNHLDIDAGSFPSGASLSQVIDAGGWQFFRRHFFPAFCSSGLSDSKSQA